VERYYIEINGEIFTIEAVNKIPAVRRALVEYHRKHKGRRISDYKISVSKVTSEVEK